mmetsp:Transcript_23661/g.55989  ORF Transcript_23661/g.55989 Transcript_23661/m.55989 type:complete len:117 (-) Transcript_23661:475-825(-)
MEPAIAAIFVPFTPRPTTAERVLATLTLPIRGFPNILKPVGKPIKRVTMPTLGCSFGMDHLYLKTRQYVWKQALTVRRTRVPRIVISRVRDIVSAMRSDVIAMHVATVPKHKSGDV